MLNIIEIDKADIIEKSILCCSCAEQLSQFIEMTTEVRKGVEIVVTPIHKSSDEDNDFCQVCAPEKAPPNNKGFGPWFWPALTAGAFVTCVKEAAKGKTLNNPEEAFNVIKPLCAEEDDVEHFFVIFQSAKNKILSIERMFSGTITQAAVYPREVIKKGLSVKASAVVLAHNHPSGDPTPSCEDYEITRRIVIGLEACSIHVHDHIIVGNTYHSMRDSGSLDRITKEFQSFITGKGGNFRC